MTPISSYSGNTIWLDATLSSNWSSGVWINNASSKFSNAITLSGTWSSTSRVVSAINGLPAILFTGSNSLYTTDPSFTYQNGITFFVVFQPTSTVSNRTLINRTSQNLPAPFDIYNNVRSIGNGSGYEFFYSPLNFNNLSLNTPYIFTIRISVSGSTATSSEWLNGSVIYSNTRMSNLYQDTCNNGVQIGTRSDKATSFKGYMGEIMVYNSVLTDSQVSAIHSYLSQKWKITLTT